MKYEEILNMVCGVCSVSLDRVKSKSRKRIHVDARRIYSDLCFSLKGKENINGTTFSLSKCGEIIGKRSHDNIIYYIKTAKGLVVSDKVFKEKHDICSRYLKSISRESNKKKKEYIEKTIDSILRSSEEVGFLKQKIVDFIRKLDFCS